MTRTIVTTWLIAAGILVAATGVRAEQSDLAITGATVHTLTEAGVIEDAVVLVSEGEIQAVGADLAVPDGFEVLDAAGRIVTPGLIESYSQLGLVEISGESTTADGRITDYPSGAAFDVRYALNADSVALAVNRRDGVTRAIVAPSAGNDPFAGWGVAIRLGGEMLLTREDIGLFGSIGNGSAEFVGGSRSAVVQRMRRGLEMAGNYNPARYQPGPGDFSHQDLAALKRFRQSRAPLVLSVDRANEIREAVALADDFECKLIIVGGTEAWKVRDLLAAEQIPVVINVMANLPSSYDRLGARLDNAAMLHAAGVAVMLTGGETQNARLLRQQAGNAIAQGLPWEAALAAITSEPARVWGFPSGTGTLQAGAPADLVIWSGDPLELTNWAERVMIDGRWQDMNSRQTRLFDRYRDLSDGDFQYR